MIINRDQIISVHQQKILANINTELIKSKKFKVVVDSVNCSGGEIAKQILEKLNCKVITINQQTDIPFERPAEPVPANLTTLGQAVLDNKADIGFATQQRRCPSHRG